MIILIIIMIIITIIMIVITIRIDNNQHYSITSIANPIVAC